MKTCEHCGAEILSQRTLLQNRSLHLMFTNIADQFNSHGLTFDKEINGIHFELIHTMQLVKEEYWAPIQLSMFGIESTTELNTKQPDIILDVLTKGFAQCNIPVVWPSKLSQWDEMQAKLNK